MSKERIVWVDAAKLIGIYLVILGHISLADSNPSNFIYSFHMPLFFFLAGVVTKHEDFKTALKKSARALLVPYVVFYLLFYALWLYASFYRHSEIYERTVFNAIIRPLCGMILGVGFETDYTLTVNTPLWFLPSLFCCKLIFSLLDAIEGKKKIFIHLAALLFFVVASYFLSVTDRFLPFSLGSTFLAYPFFMAGNAFSKLNIRHPKKLICPLVSILCLGTGYFIASHNGRVNINEIWLGNNIILLYAGGGILIMGITFLCFCIDSLPPLFSVLARNTLLIMALHSLLLTITLKIVSRIFSSFSKDAVPIFYALPIALFVFLVHLIPVELLAFAKKHISDKSHKTNSNEVNL